MQNLEQLLLSTGATDGASLARARTMRASQGASALSLGEVLVRLGILDEERLVRLIAQELGLPIVQVSNFDLSDELLAMIPADLAAYHGVIPLLVDRRRDGKNVLHLAMVDPFDEEAVERVSRSTGLQIRRVAALPSDVRQAIDTSYSLTLDTVEIEPDAAPLRAPPARPPMPKLPPMPPASAGISRVAGVTTEDTVPGARLPSDMHPAVVPDAISPRGAAPVRVPPAPPPLAATSEPEDTTRGAALRADSPPEGDTEVIARANLPAELSPGSAPVPTPVALPVVTPVATPVAAPVPAHIAAAPQHGPPPPRPGAITSRGAGAVLPIASAPLPTDDDEVTSRNIMPSEFAAPPAEFTAALSAYGAPPSEFSSPLPNDFAGGYSDFSGPIPGLGPNGIEPTPVTEGPDVDLGPERSFSDPFAESVPEPEQMAALPPVSVPEEPEYINPPVSNSIPPVLGDFDVPPADASVSVAPMSTAEFLVPQTEFTAPPPRQYSVPPPRPGTGRWSYSPEAMPAVRPKTPSRPAPAKPAPESEGLAPEAARAVLVLAIMQGESVRISMRGAAAGEKPRVIEGRPVGFRASNDGRDRVVLEVGEDHQQLVLLARIANITPVS